LPTCAVQAPNRENETRACQTNTPFSRPRHLNEIFAGGADIARHVGDPWSAHKVAAVSRAQHRESAHTYKPMYAPPAGFIEAIPAGYALSIRRSGQRRICVLRILGLLAPGSGPNGAQPRVSAAFPSRSGCGDAALRAAEVEPLTRRFPLFYVDTEVRNLHNQSVEPTWLRVPGFVMAIGNRKENGLDAMVQSIAEHLESLPAEERQSRIKAFVSRRSSKPRPASNSPLLNHLKNQLATDD